MKKKPLIYLEFTFRGPDEDRQDFSGVAIPVLRAWQEDANDLHIALDGPDGRDGVFVRPEVDKKTGDYALPFDSWLGDAEDFLVRLKHTWLPDGDKPVLRPAAVACTMAWKPSPSDKSIVAPPAYVRLLESLWYSPNR